jgi:ribose transport system ATP-binding protein
MIDNPVCALRDLGKSFGGVFACRHVDLEVKPGEVLALTGENGAGKSTTVKCVSSWRARATAPRSASP